MIDPRRPHRILPRHPDPAGVGSKPLWIAITDWLGARKPLHLILGAVTIIALIAMVTQLG